VLLNPTLLKNFEGGKQKEVLKNSFCEEEKETFPPGRKARKIYTIRRLKQKKKVTAIRF